MRRPRILKLALLLCVVVDYSDPSVPGVFAFKAGGLFLDGALDGRAQPLKARPESPGVREVAGVRPERLCAEPSAVPLPPVDRSPVARGHARLVLPSSSDDRSDDH